jgi:hypothetical protein
VRRAILTPAYVNESVVAAALPIGDETAVYATRATTVPRAMRASPSGDIRRDHAARPPEGAHPLVDLGAEPGDLALRDATHPQRLDQVVD